MEVLADIPVEVGAERIMSRFHISDVIYSKFPLIFKTRRFFFLAASLSGGLWLFYGVKAKLCGVIPFFIDGLYLCDRARARLDGG